MKWTMDDGCVCKAGFRYDRKKRACVKVRLLAARLLLAVLCPSIAAGSACRQRRCSPLRPTPWLQACKRGYALKHGKRCVKVHRKHQY